MNTPPRRSLRLAALRAANGERFQADEQPGNRLAGIRAERFQADEQPGNRLAGLEPEYEVEEVTVLKEIDREPDHNSVPCWFVLAAAGVYFSILWWIYSVGQRLQ